MLSIKVDEEEILVGKVIWGDWKIGSPDDSYLSRSIFKSPNKSICLNDYFQSLYNKGEI